MDPRICEAIEFMQVNFNRRLTQSELAHQAGITAQHFSFLFKHETGDTPVKFLNALRLEEARRLLECQQHPHLSIKEIAVAVGFHDLSHFVRDFERRFGLSPKRYRAQAPFS